MFRYGLQRTAQRAAGVRGFAAEASHKPVLRLHGLAARYANATYVAASKVGSLEAVEQELLALQETAAKSAEFSAFLNNPLIPRNQKADEIAKMTSGKFSLLTTNLLTTLAGNARLSELPKVAATYEKLMRAKRGEVDAILITAEELTAKQSKSIADAVMAGRSGDQKVILKTKVDPSILGGFQVLIGDEFLDLSVKSQVEDISRMPLA
ncbi:synthase subunit O, mitochondrial [Seminavis robusta]|uniref:Synthase subunit O, mitochondrial n=1 Tax=Seminavis robusta TaxID=568900 RepID=A0A9N8EHX1_9STRA|nr:synthase subunit O, mitochondrial [Seminavis robusta]|eukprot:Sro1247_g255840.1 synthase subunit O, mitochondrial (209) ;mRNA; f:3075-3701